ncbi:hypothetical protein PIROE2DRAFT_1468 [Piromyces sp. E2]|nr:hypothetical protein PIROE2DRAFT_1468 [Piromyces sp. E2]|eukprot:OUM70335.1 hypothetical protein PIROE2DRAFT_1468 [Piromyces sp. E2]
MCSLKLRKDIFNSDSIIVTFTNEEIISENSNNINNSNHNSDKNNNNNDSNSNKAN